MRKPLLGLVLCIGLAVPSGVAVAGSENLSALPLLDLNGDFVPVRYSAGSLHRAAQLQQSFELLAAQFARFSDSRARLQLLLLSRDEWEGAALGQPYGVAMRVFDHGIAVAAWGDSGTVELWQRLLGGELPSAEDAPMRSSEDEAAGLQAADVLALFEGARILTAAAGYGGAEPWIGDLVSHVVALTALARLPGGIRQADVVYRALGRVRAPSDLRTYAGGLSLEQWLAFQARFHAGAVLVLEQEKRGTLRSIVKLAKKSRGRLRADQLAQRYPALRVWLESFGSNQ